MTVGRREDILSNTTVDSFNQKVADPTFFCGGGSVAAITASSAAALTLLVMGLNAGRKINRQRKADIQRQIAEVESLQQTLYAGADRDLDVLEDLLQSQRQIKETGDRGSYQAALFTAARSPYEICERCLRLLEMIEAQLPLASRFTVSDLGAAAALTMGAIQGALLTTDVNVALLRDESDMDHEQIDRIEIDSIELVRSAAAIAERIRKETVDAIHRKPERRQA